MNYEADVERIFMIAGKDAHGDTEMFMTTDRGRADARYIEMVGRLHDVQKNDAWDTIDNRA